MVDKLTICTQLILINKGSSWIPGKEEGGGVKRKQQNTPNSENQAGNFLQKAVKNRRR